MITPCLQEFINSVAMEIVTVSKGIFINIIDLTFIAFQND